MRRRDFVAAIGAAGLPSTSDLRPSTPLGTLGVQLYTVRDLLRRNFEDTLHRVRAIGYREVEFAGYAGKTPEQVRQALRDAELDAPANHVGLETLEGDQAARSFDAARTVGHRWLVVAWMPVEWRRTLDDWRRIADRFNRVGESARAAGLRFAYHNHDFEFRPLEGRIPFELLCEGTDPRVVEIEVDLFWMTHGGADPLAFFERWPGRVPMVHVKDRTTDGRMVDVGAGAIDWRRLFAARRPAGIRHFFVEHDEPADPFDSIRTSYAYLRRLDV